MPPVHVTCLCDSQEMDQALNASQSNVMISSEMGDDPGNTDIARVTYVGHATILIELNGKRILTDPLLTRWVGPLRRQWPPVDPVLVQDIDMVLLSHLHHDHLHLPSLSRLGPETRFVVPAGAGEFLRGRGMRNIREVRPGDAFMVDDVEVHVVHADHDASRPLTNMTAQPQGFVLGGSHSIYFAGDTDLFPEMRDLAALTDVALLPVWGWGPTLGTGHLDPVRAAEAAALIQPRIAVPIHWGTYFPAGLPWRRELAMNIAAREFSLVASEVAPEVDVRIIQPGESLPVPPRADE